MRASLIAAVFAAGALASPINKRDLIVETHTNIVTQWVYETVDSAGAAATPAPVAATTSAVAVAAVTPAPVAAPAPAQSPAAVKPQAAPAKQVSKPAAAAQAAPAAQAVSGYQDLVLLHHNVHRANHSASDVQWDSDLESSAQTIADSCNYAHNTDVNGGGYGQNIAAGVDADHIGQVISDLFYNGEAGYYTYYGSEPDMSTFEHWGHFSQVVWKGTSSVACVTKDCSAQGLANVGSDVPPYFTVCNYRAPGNFGGEYNDNIGAPLGNPTVTGDYTG